MLWKETASLNHISKRVNVDEMRVGMLLAGLRSVGGWDAEHWEDEDEDEDQDGDGEVRRRRVTGYVRQICLLHTARSEEPNDSHTP